MKRRRWYRGGSRACRGGRLVGDELRDSGLVEPEAHEGDAAAQVGRPSPSSPATTRRRRRVTTRTPGSTSTSRSAARRSCPSRSFARQAGGVRDQLAPEPARKPRHGERSRQHRPGLHEVGNDRGDLEEGRDQQLQADARQEVRRLDLRKRVRAARRAREERHGSGQGRDPRPAAVRHGRVPEARDRRRVGDDVQRARPGPGDEEPGDRQALQAERSQGLQVLRPRHGHAPGRDLRPRRLDQGARRTRRRR